MNLSDLIRRLDDLTARLEKVERVLGLTRKATPSSVEPKRGEQATPSPPGQPKATPVAPPTAPPVAPPPVVAHPHAGSSPPQRAKVKTWRRMAAEGRAGAGGKRGTPLDISIAPRLLAWAGSLMVVVGIGYLVKYGYDEGWWGRLHPVLRCLAVAAFGGLLIAAGEVTLRRLGRAASVGLFGAGLGTLYLDSYAAFAWLEPPLVGREAAFGLMAVVALIGFGLTLRTAFLTIGILSMLGGYGTLWLLRGPATHVLEVGAYLTLLLGIALALSGANPAKFRPLRYVALGGQGIVGLGWVLGAVSFSWFVALLFATLWWAMVLIETVVAAMRRQSSAGNVVASLLSTAWFVTVGGWVLAGSQPAGSNWLGVFTGAVAVLAVVVAFQFGPPPKELGRPRVAIDYLAVALWAQAGVLVAVAIALQFSDYGQSIGWLATGLASIEIGRRLRFRAVEIFGLVLWALAAGRVAFFDPALPALQGVVWSSSHITITHWSLLGLAAVGVTHVAAQRVSRIDGVPPILAGIGTLGWMAVCVLQTGTMTTTCGWLLASVILLASDRAGRRQRYFELGLLTLVATAGKWLVLDTVVHRLGPGWTAGSALPFLNWQMALAVAITATGWWAGRLLTQRRRVGGALGSVAKMSVGGQWAVLGAAVFLLVALSFELNHLVDAVRASGAARGWSADHVYQLWLTALWAAGAVALGIVARALRAPAAYGHPAARPMLLLAVARGLLVICCVKWLFADTLLWVFLEPLNRHVPLPMVNVQLLVGAMLAGAALLLYAIGRTDESEPPRRTGIEQAGSWVPVAATVLLLWGLSFEADRAIEAFGPTDWFWLHLRFLWWTVLWAAGGLAMILWTRLRPSAAMALGGVGMLCGAALVWLIPDTFAWRHMGVVPATPVLNLQFGVGAVVAAMLAVSAWHARSPAEYATEAERRIGMPAAMIAWSLIGLIGLWLGSLEIERWFVSPDGQLVGSDAMARQSGWSIFGALYAIGLLVVGFARNVTGCQRAGLALLLFTMAKVTTVDLAGVSEIYRVLSFVGVGLLAVGTSVLYWKLASRQTQVTTPSR